MSYPNVESFLPVPFLLRLPSFLPHSPCPYISMSLNFLYFLLSHIGSVNTCTCILHLILGLILNGTSLGLHLRLLIV